MAVIKAAFSILPSINVQISLSEIYSTFAIEITARPVLGRICYFYHGGTSKQFFLAKLVDASQSPATTPVSSKLQGQTDSASPPSAY